MEIGLEFYDWLIAQGRKPKTAKSYSGPISGRLSDHAKLIEAPSFDHRQLESGSKFKTYCIQNDDTEELYELNKRGKDMCRTSINLSGWRQLTWPVFGSAHDTFIFSSFFCG